MPTPLFELAPYTSGSPWHHDVPRFVRRAAPRRRGVPQPLQHHLFGRSWHQFGSARAGNSGHRSSVVERSVASSGGVVVSFRDDSFAKPVLWRSFCLRSLNLKAQRAAVD